MKRSKVPPAYRRQAIKFWKFLALWAGLPVSAQHIHLPLAASFLQLAGKQTFFEKQRIKEYGL